MLLLTGLSALFLLWAWMTLLIGESSGWPKDRYATVAGLPALAGLVLFGFGTFAPIAAWALLPLYERLLGADDGRLGMMRHLPPSKRSNGRG